MSSKVAPPTSRRVPLMSITSQSALQACPTTLSYRGIFSIDVPSSQMTPAGVKLIQNQPAQNGIGDGSLGITVGNCLHYINWYEKTHQTCEETIPCVGSPGQHQRGENKPSTSMHAAFHHSLPLTVDVKWPVLQVPAALTSPQWWAVTWNHRPRQISTFLPWVVFF